MNNEDTLNLAIARIERAKELYHTAMNTYTTGDFKSANNRSYYAIEKAATALLILKGSSPKTHIGILSEFNRLYINIDHSYFSKDDYIAISKTERIRTASDYDDFYIASNSETNIVLTESCKFVNKVIQYLDDQNIVHIDRLSVPEI